RNFKISALAAEMVGDPVDLTGVRFHLALHFEYVIRGELLRAAELLRCGELICRLFSHACQLLTQVGQLALQFRHVFYGFTLSVLDAIETILDSDKALIQVSPHPLSHLSRERLCLISRAPQIRAYALFNF